MNIKQIKEDEEVMIEDLKNVADCVRQIMQKQSISFVIHQRDKAAPRLPVHQKSSMKITDYKLGKMSSKDAPAGQESPKSENKDMELYNSFLSN